MKQQTDLHHYFQTQAELPDDELLANLREMTAAYPSLPNRAGKAFVQMDGAFRVAYEQSSSELLLFYQAVWRLVPQRHPAKATTLKGSAASRRICAAPVMTCGVDAKLLAQAVLMQLHQEADKAKRHDDSATDQSGRAA